MTHFHRRHCFFALLKRDDPDIIGSVAMQEPRMRVDVAIVGAGPYGLSLAAHLKAREVGFRIFGHAMQTWLTQMPQGMFLKSPGFASTLFDPRGHQTLARHCEEHGVAYADVDVPVDLETFVAHGLSFQRRLVPELEPCLVHRVAPDPEGFRLRLDTGEEVVARRVVIAAGISHFAHLPAELCGLPPERLSHSSAHRDFRRFADRSVTVLGGGASALDCAQLLQRAGASVQLVARRLTLAFHARPGRQPRPLLERLRSPMSGLGPGWKSRLCTDAPLLFHRMPERFRLEIVRRHLGPAPCWWTREGIEGSVPIHLGMRLTRATVRDDLIHLDLEDPAAGTLRVASDHVIAATGYRVDLNRLGFLAPELRVGLRTTGDAPVLSAQFESSVPGCYFVGAAAANSFGPMLRFAYGAGFTARHLSRALARTRPSGARTGAATAPVGTLADA